MDKPELQSVLERVRAEMAADSARLEELERQAGLLQAEQHRRQARASALANMPSDDPLLAPAETMKLTEAILSVVRQRPVGLPLANLAMKAIRLAPSKSDNPQRVAEVRIGQLLKEGRLMERGGRIIIGPNA